MARNSHFRKNICAGLSQPEVAARVMSYWSESPCSSRLHESRRDREEFSGPENWLVTGAARLEMPQKGPQMCAIRPKNRWKPRQMSHIVRLCVSGMAPQNLVGPRKSARSVCYNPRKWRETNVFRKACASASSGLKYRPEWCPTSRSLRVHPGYMKFMEIERNFLGLKTSSSRVLRGTKCPKEVPRRAP